MTEWITRNLKNKKAVTFWMADHIYRVKVDNKEDGIMDTQAIGQRIQIAREECYMTQRELAAAVDCTPQHISAIERGAKTLTLETYGYKLARTADVELADMLLSKL